MAFSSRPVRAQGGSPAFVSARTGTLSRSTTGAAPGSPKTRPTLTSAVQTSLKGQPGTPGPGQTWSHATPGHGSPGTWTDHDSPGSPSRAAAGQQWQPRDRTAIWQYNQRPDRRRSEAVHVQVGLGSPGIKRIQTGDEGGTSATYGRSRTNTEGSRQSPRQQALQTQASRHETLQLGSPAKQISSKPTFQDPQRSPGIESVSTNTGGVGGGNPWSPGRSPYALKRYSVGGATKIFTEEDIPKEDHPISAVYYGEPVIGARTCPMAWTHSEKLRKWERRLHGDPKVAEQDEQLRDYREQQQAHDASLTEAFGRSVQPAPGSPRAKSCEAPSGSGNGIAGHPSQRGMRAAFTDRALRQAHMSEHFSLAHSEDDSDTQSQRTSIASIACMPAAGNGGLTKGPKGVLARMHMDSAGAGSPRNSARAAKSTDSNRVGYHLSHPQVSEDPERDQVQVKDEEGFFRRQMANRHPGDMAPTTRDITKARARSADSFAGFSRSWGAKLDIFGNAVPTAGDGSRTERRHVQDWLPSDRVTMAQCLSSARDDAAAEPVEIVFMQGHSPPSTKVSNTCNKKFAPRDGGRPDYWFDRTRAYSTGRRKGRGEGYEHSAESTKQSIARDAESKAMYRYELIACGEATPRARSQPPVYNPLTHEGELYPSLASSRSRGKAMTPRSARLSGTRSVGRLLDFQAGRDEDEELRTSRMMNDQAFSEICQFTARQHAGAGGEAVAGKASARQNDRLSQEFAQRFRQHSHKNSSNMALLLSWE